MVSAQTDRLWACHACKMLGSGAEAKAHYIAKGHDCEELSQEASDGIRAEWNAARLERVGDLIAARRSGMLGGVDAA